MLNKRSNARLLPLLLLLCLAQGLQAQGAYALKTHTSTGDSTLRMDTKLTQQSLNYIAPSFLVLGGIATYAFDDHFHTLREAHTPTFHQTYDEYTQYLPAAVMLGMKVAGVKGKSTWGELILSDAIGVAIGTAMVGGLKIITTKERPDGTDQHSFPSGHTARAFMAATMLHKEYGELSPWISIGAYTCATATGMTRLMNNRHWMSDVLAGAGIGIASVEIGYYLADVILGRKRGYYASPARDYTAIRPSYIGMNVGVRKLWTDLSTAEGAALAVSNGSSVGVEGAYFFNKHWGIGGQATIASYLFERADTKQRAPLGLLSTALGAYYSTPFSPLFRMETKLLIGKSWRQTSEAFEELNADLGNPLHYATGLAINFAATPTLELKVFGEYTLTPHFVSDQTAHTTTLGLSTNLCF